MNRHAGLLIGCLLLPLSAPADAAGAGDIVIDTDASRIGFLLRTRWAQTLEGRFGSYEGRVATTPDGRRQVRLILHAGSVEIVGQPRYTRLTRGEGFFDAQRHPEVEFVSEHFQDALLIEGGELSGILGIRGVRRHERFTVSPAMCTRPLVQCQVVVAGDVSRSDYAMDRWDIALSDRVQLTLILRGLGTDAP